MSKLHDHRWDAFWESEAEREAQELALCKTSARGKDLDLWGDDDLFGGNTIEVPQVQAPRAPSGLGNPFDDDPEEDADDDEEEGGDPILPSSFQVVPRKLSWEDRTPDVSDFDLAARYRTQKDPQALESLMARHKDHLTYAQRSLNQFRLPTATTAGMTYNTWAHSVSRWDPSKGRNLPNLHKLDQSNAHARARTLGQFTKAERGRISKIQRTRQLQRDFEADHGRFGTAKELAEASQGEITYRDMLKIMQEDRGKLMGSKEMDADTSVDVARAMTHAVQRARDYYGSNHRKMIDSMWGLGGEEYVASNNVLAKKYGVTPQYMSTLKRRFVADIQTEMRNMGVE